MLSLSKQIHPLRSAIARRALGAFSAAVLACGAVPAHADLAEVRSIMSQRLRANKQSFNPAAVQETLISGLYRWDQGGNVGQIYINEAATLMLITNGNKIVEWDQPVRNPQPISATQKTLLLSEMIKNLRFDKLIHIRQGTGANRVLLLSALDCPYCIQFERMADGAGSRLNTDFYVVPSTLQQSSPAQAASVRNIWCADDNAAAWRTTLMAATRGYATPAAQRCDRALRATQDVELILRSAGLFNGYPLMIFGTGEVATPSGDAAKFTAQLGKEAGSGFWAQPRPELYAQFRVAGVAGVAGDTGSDR